MTGLLVLLSAAAVAGAGAAVAIDDPTRPDARVTHGPSCHPGGIVVEVVAGRAPYTVRLATTRRPAGEDEATLTAQGASVVLRTGDVAPGETIDPRLEFTARDGSGVAYVDELEEYTLTRPTVEDCELALSPPPPPPAPPTAGVDPAPSAGAGTAGGSSPRSGVPVTTDRAPRTTNTSSGTRTAGTGTPSVTADPAKTAPAVAAGSAAHLPSVGAPHVRTGGTVTLRGAGFMPGERVDILVQGSDTVLATATADAGGAVRVDVRMPQDVTAGPATLDLVGADSAVSTGVDLQVAAGQEPAGTRGVVSLASLVVAAVALVATVGGVVTVAGQQHADRRRREPIRTP